MASPDLGDVAWPVALVGPNDSLACRGRSTKMPLLAHLDELRRRLLICLVAVVPGSLMTFVEMDRVLRFLLMPLPAEATFLGTRDGAGLLAVTHVGEAFSIVLKLAIAGGVAAAAPVWIYQLYWFTAPALKPRESRYALPFSLLGFGLFISGLAVGFVTLKYPLAWLLGFGDDHFAKLITADSYFTFVAFFVLAFGVAFELPLVMVLLVVVGLLRPETIKEQRAKILVALWIAACVITPGADPYSPLIVGVALTALFAVGTGIVKLIDPRIR
jgi:sec-independent protein translocase protein TatC